MKLYVYITDIEAALKDDFAWSMTISDRDDLGGVGGNSWYLAGDIDADISINREALTKAAIIGLEEKITEVNAATSLAVTSLEARKQNLLAIAFDGDSS